MVMRRDCLLPILPSHSSPRFRASQRSGGAGVLASPHLCPVRPPGRITGGPRTPSLLVASPSQPWGLLESCSCH